MLSVYGWELVTTLTRRVTLGTHPAVAALKCAAFARVPEARAMGVIAGALEDLPLSSGMTGRTCPFAVTRRAGADISLGVHSVMICAATALGVETDPTRRMEDITRDLQKIFLKISTMVVTGKGK